jgi:hypothetical protein
MITMPDAVPLKQQLHVLCRAFVEDRIATARQAIQQAQASANEETKSSSGDKYETGRAMAQLEIEKSSGQLAEAMKLKQALDQVHPDQAHSVVQSGSLVFTSQGNYYISVSAGRLVVDGGIYYAVSPGSPVGMKLMTLSAGAKVMVNAKEVVVERVV